MAAILRRHTYVVLEAADGRQATAVADSRPGPIQLLVSDVVIRP